MSNATIRIKKRLDQGGASAGAPSSLKPSELAFNEVDSKLYYGKGESGGDADSIIAIGGDGAFLSLSGTQTAAGNKTFSNDIVIGGNLTVNGTTTSLQTTNSVVKDSLIELGNGTTGSPANDAGLVIERGSSANAFIGWDESADQFHVGTGTFTGADTGNLDITTGTLKANVVGNVTGNVTGNTSGSSGSCTGNAAGLTGTPDVTVNDVTAASLDISGNADIDGTLEADAITLNGTALATSATTDTTNASNISSGTLAAARFPSSSASVGFVVDEDNMSSDSATKVPTQQSVKAYVDANTGGTVSSFSVSANNSTDETVYPLFVDGATGTQSPETDTGFTYNPNSGNLVIGGQLAAASLDISGDVDVDGTLEADAITVNGSALATSALTDATNASNISSGTLAAARVGNLSASKITSGTFDAARIPTLNQDTTGSAATLGTARNIGGVSFDGSANINLPGVNTSGNQDTSGTAAVATAITVADESSDTTCFPLFSTSATGNLGAKSGSNLTFNSATGLLTATTLAGVVDGGTF